jgi:hypothetical protein
MNNTNAEPTQDIIIVLEHLLVLPEYLGLLFLLTSIYGMYQGIEIRHPLYTILFINLIVPAICSAIDILSFYAMPKDKFVKISNSNSAISLFFHTNCWYLTSGLGYIYILHGDWIDNFD